MTNYLLFKERHPFTALNDVLAMVFCCSLLPTTICRIFKTNTRFFYRTKYKERKASEAQTLRKF